jgi:uncharacterized protein
MPQRIMWLSLGLLAMGCGIAGAVLPILPTTPFLLLAVFAFARSSPRLHTRLMTHPNLGPPIAAWNRDGAIPRRAKRTAVLIMGASLVLSAAAGIPVAILAMQALGLSAAACFILSRPDAA